MKDRLNASVWVDMALQVLGQEGVEAVRVEPLARSLGVTKGSFYWHFSDRQALLDASLRQWERLATHDVIDRVERACAAPDDRLRELTRLAFRHGGPLDRAVRAWATHDENAAGAVARVDARRYRFVRELLEAYGMPREMSAMRGRLFYTALVGEQHVSLKLSSKRRVAWALANLESLLASI